MTCIYDMYHRKSNKANHPLTNRDFYMHLLLGLKIAYQLSIDVIYLYKVFIICLYHKLIIHSI